MLRKTIFWLHLTAGITVGTVVLIMSVTGVLLTYQKQMQAWADLRGIDGSAPAGNVSALSTQALIASAQSVNKGKPSAVRWRAGDDRPVEVVFGRDGSVFLNAYTGAVLGNGGEGMREFFRIVTEWHRWLARQDDARESGKAITGAANLAFLFIVLSGFYLWWPRNWTRAAFRSILMFRTGLRAKARDFNWHNVIGVWSLVPLFIIIVSGAVIGYPWASNLVYRAMGEEPPAPAAPAAPQNAAEPKAPKPKLDLTTIDPVVARAKQQEADWRLLTMQLEPAKDGGVTFNVDRGNGGQPQKRATLVLSETGQVKKWEPFSKGTPGRQLRTVLRYAHTGEVLGIPGQTVAGLATTGAVVLVYTGIALALRRLFAWRRRKNDPRLQDQPARAAGGPRKSAASRRTA